MSLRNPWCDFVDKPFLVPQEAPVTIPRKHVATIEEYTRRIAVAMRVVGLLNVQYAIADDKVYILEANPRASRTVPIVSKVCDISMARLATQAMLGEKIADMGLRKGSIPHFGVKEAIFPFYMFPEVDPILGPEMRSTGEVLGMDASFGLAFFKAQEAALAPLPLAGTVLFTIADQDKEGALEAARRFAGLGVTILATEGTRAFLSGKGVEATGVKKMHEGRPNLVDGITNGEIHLVINTPAGRKSANDDSYIRKAAIRNKVPYITTIAGAIAAATGIEARRAGRSGVRSLQEYHSAIIP